MKSINSTFACCLFVLAVLRVDAQQMQESKVTARRIEASEDTRAELYAVGPSHFGPDGRIYVVEDNLQTIRVFDAVGKFVTNIGRKGAGPGEFTGIRQFGWIGDTLWVNDGNSRRITTFDRTYKVIQTMSWDVEGVRTSHVGDVMTPNGRVVQLNIGNQNEDNRPAPLLRTTRTGKVIDTLQHLTQTRTLVRVDANGKTRMLLQPFIDQPLWETDRTGRWLAVVQRTAPKTAAPSRIEVKVYDLKNGTSKNIGVPYTPLAITKRSLDSVFTKRYSPDLTEEILRPFLDIPAFFPPVNGLTVADDGSVWLQRWGLAANTWIRLDANGVQTDIVRIPAEYFVSDVRGRELLASIPRPDDTQAPLTVFTVVK